MLSKGLRDEEKKKIDDAFIALLDIEFVPNLWENEQRNKLNEKLQAMLNITLDAIENMTSEALLEKLKAADFEFRHYEQFGDLMLRAIPLEPEEKESLLATHTAAVYETAQKESKTFSFGLIQKINNAKALI